MVFSSLPVNLTDSSNPFNGIVNYYISKTDNYLSYIKATASTRSDITFRTFNPSAYSNSWCTDMNQENPQWYQVELHKAIGYMTKYSIRSSGNNETSSKHLTNWDLVASIDGYKWETIDNEETNKLQGKGFYYTFSIRKPGLYRFFRIIQSKPNSDLSYGFSIRQFDLFGILYESSYVPVRQQLIFMQHRFVSQNFLLVMLMFISD